MDAIKMGIGFGLWQQGMPDAHTLFEYIDKAEAWGIDSVWLSDHMMGERAEVSIVPMMAAIAARTPQECRERLQRFSDYFVFRGAADAGGVGIPLMTSCQVRFCWDLQNADDV